MNREDFYALLSSLEEVCAEGIGPALGDAKRLADHGETRIALENLLENLNEIGTRLSPEQLNQAERAFGDAISDHDQRLLQPLRERGRIGQKKKP